MRAFIKQHRFMFLCLGILWIKTFIVSMVTFELAVNQALEAFIFIVNPLAFLLIVFSLGLLMKPSWQRPYYVILTIALSALLYANAVYYREFSDIITLPMLVMSGNMGDLSTSIFELIRLYDIIFFIDCFILLYLMVKRPKQLTVERAPLKRSKAKYGIIVSIVAVILVAGQTYSPEQPVHSFDRDYLIRSLGIYNFYFYDAYLQLATNSQTAFAERDDLTAIKEHLERFQVEPNQDLTGVAEGKNIVYISLESVEEFVIDKEINGQEVTPFLNELKRSSFYFSNIYDQAGQGKTSDTEFMMANSLYPLGRGAVFHTNAATNQLMPFQSELQELGYFTTSFHANTDTFYNRNEVYPNLGYDSWHDTESFTISDENSVGWGMKDIPFFEQSMDYIKELPQPFYASFLTLTNHFPYELDPEDYFMDPPETDSDIVNRYFPAVRYTDEAVKVLFDEMKEAGLYEDTVFVLYGDHYGIAASHYDQLEQVLGYEIDDYEALKLDTVPLFIHIPGMEEEAEISDTVGGLVDVMPTMLNLLGMSRDEHVMFGHDLLAEERDDFVVLRNGNIVTNELVYTREFCYRDSDKQELPLDRCFDIAERGTAELNYSDEIIYGDLLRFFRGDEG
ncbi:LTA synthase family protein [Paenalkalicoccus suaedae]|uniref:LTA synthase family protein n=1 Tax=Paenalkalicoccus suaedae TaxID=2592382 RepID=A0A859FJE2_9BACI|nr:LTA synthase family protein [Paenalkalicoccus suaedae]QKS72875.1 LTA synthase family protein [Paenalkalicoccus suaedae]